MERALEAFLSSAMFLKKWHGTGSLGGTMPRQNESPRKNPKEQTTTKAMCQVEGVMRGVNAETSKAAVPALKKVTNKTTGGDNRKKKRTVGNVVLVKGTSIIILGNFRRKVELTGNYQGK